MKIKKSLAILMAVIMLLSMVPTMAFAQDDVLNFLEYAIEFDEVIITGYKGEPVDLVIPSEIEGKPVTSIGDYAFKECSSLQSVTISDSVISIGSSAFEGCSSLESITIPASVTSMGYGAFYDTACYNNESNWENGIFYIGDRLFYASGNISGDITIKKGTRIIEDFAFECCSKLKSINITDGVESIGGLAFDACFDLENVTMTDSVKEIGNGAFRGTNLKTVKISQNIEKIGYDVFNGTPFYDASWKNGELYIGNVLIAVNYEISGNYTVKYGTKAIAGNALAGCSLINKVAIPDTVKGIGDYAFYSCSSLKDITIPKSVTYISSEAFKECSSLVAINVDTNNNNYCSIDGILFDKGITKIIKYPNMNPKTSYTIPDTVTRIDEATFSGCSLINRITIPDSVIDIGNYAFSDCSSLQNVTIPDSVVSIGQYAFCRCSSLQNITIPDSVVSIAEGVFSSCSSLQNVTISASVTTIDRFVFNYCTELLNVTIPDSVTSIDDQAFFKCNSLQSVVIPDSVTSIGEAAFNGCTSLQNVTIPDSVTIIEASAFFDTAYYDNEANWEDGVLYIGNHLINAKEDITGDYEVKNGTKTIADSAFHSCSSLVSIKIPDSVIRIGDRAFYNCVLLQSITIPDSVTSIGKYMFTGCYSLESITIPDSITNIGYSAFEDCSSLQSIIIPDSVTIIGESSFSNCSSLQSITIPDSVTSIDRAAFYDCTSLTTVNYTGTEKQWNEINIATFRNDALASATINFAPPCAHNNTTVLAAVPATCTEMGLTEGKKCADCGEIIVKQESTPTVDHSFGEWTTTKEATETDNGEMTRKCLTCDKTESQIIFKLVYKNELVNEENNIVIKYSDESFNGELTLEVTQEFDGDSVNLLKKEKGNFNSVVFDINPKINGEKVQPNGKILVGIPLPEGFNRDNTIAVYIGESSIEDLETYYMDGMIWFETDHFSSYALVDQSIMKGDINGDGKITSVDARIILRISAKLEKLEDQKVTAFEVADVNGDGKITSVDARKVLRVATKLDTF